MNYEIIRIIGQGGMGAVYEGRQISLDRRVAIKLLSPAALDQTDGVDSVERFKNEARSMARMNHPGIVSVYDFGETSNDQFYLVMENVDGTDVAQMILSQGRLPDEHALSITAHVCDALQYAHSHGLIHRDIKPANILLNREGKVKIADFGLAKGIEPGATGLTRSNVTMGTPDFIAPEALIEGMTVDHRSDIYSVGVMLYNMLTGEIPRGAFKMPSVKTGSDPRFDAIIQKAVQAEREDRYQTTQELRRDLDVILTIPMVKLEETGTCFGSRPAQFFEADFAACGDGTPEDRHRTETNGCRHASGDSRAAAGAGNGAGASGATRGPGIGTSDPAANEAARGEFINTLRRHCGCRARPRGSRLVDDGRRRAQDEAAAIGGSRCRRRGSQGKFASKPSRSRPRRRLPMPGTSFRRISPSSAMFRVTAGSRCWHPGSRRWEKRGSPGRTAGWTVVPTVNCWGSRRSVAVATCPTWR